MLMHFAWTNIRSISPHLWKQTRIKQSPYQLRSKEGRKSVDCGIILHFTNQGNLHIEEFWEYHNIKSKPNLTLLHLAVIFPAIVNIYSSLASVLADNLFCKSI
jgi:hypothetical protein